MDAKLSSKQLVPCFFTWRLITIHMRGISYAEWGAAAFLRTPAANTEDGGTYYVSGFDGAVITSILGGDVVIDERTGKTRQPLADERVQAALDQPVLELVNI